MPILMAAFLLCVPITAVADALCEELWLTRNAVFDRAGYCFGSALGQAVFDNSDCTTSDPVLSAADKELISLVCQTKDEAACAVNTDLLSLSIEHVTTRLSLQDLPVRTGFESACIGYKGPALLLTGGRHPDSAITGEILPGMDLMFLHHPVDGMDFFDLGNGEMGWVGSQLLTPAVCTAIAG